MSRQSVEGAGGPKALGSLWLIQPSPTPRFCADGSREQNQNYIYLLPLQSEVGRRWY